MKIFQYSSSLALVATLACNGTETQNPNSGTTLVSFGNSGCKKETLPNAYRITNMPLTDAGIINYGGEVEGLKCFAWQTTGADSVTISLINFEEACGAQWEGSARIASDGTLQLGLTNPKCTIAMCGWCIYDWSFEVKGVDLGQDLPVTLGIDTCPGEQDVKVTSVQLPLATQSSGIMCRYANFNAVGWQAMALGTCGALGMPCTGTNMCQNTGGSTEQTCHGDLTCTDNGTASEMICAKPCTLDSDCGANGVQSCQAGVCRPKTAW
jgi:hypothetical protein